MAKIFPVTVKRITTGAGSANVAWGPDFGGADGDQFNVGVNIDLDALALENTKTVGATLTMPTLALSNTKSVGVNVDLDALAISNTKSIGCDISQLQYIITNLPASKDSWCDIVALCPVDVNHDNDFIRLDGIAATRKDGIIGWNLSGFPVDANITVTSASVTLRTQNVEGVTPVDFEAFRIAAADEVWTEDDVRCSNIPASDGKAQDGLIRIPAAAEANFTFNLNAAGLTRLESRMGVGTFSLRLVVELLDISRVLYDRNLVVGKPLLTITFTADNI